MPWRTAGVEDIQEQALAYIEDDELVEVTPESLRLRKQVLDHDLRKRDEKKSAEVSPAR